MNSETATPPHQCQCCRRICVSKSALLQHHVVHTGEKVYVCSVDGCGEKFSQAGGRKRHYQSVHSETRRFTCDYSGCEASFARNDSLQQHIRGHVGERRYPCQDPDCDKAFMQRVHASRHYDRCHSEEARLRRKLEEEKVAKCFKKAEIHFAREHHVSFRCWGGSNASADFLVLIKGAVVIIEMDEHQHSHYDQSCEVARMAKIHEALTLEGSTLPVVIIRYNPHAFKVDGATKRTTSRTRQRGLVETIRSLRPGQDGTLRIVYMYYDAITTDGDPTLCIWNSQDYNSEIRGCCRRPTI